MTNRARLPNRRRSETFGIPHPGDLSFKPVRYDVAVSRDEAGAPREVFVSCSKLTTAQDIAGRDIAILISIALQYGAPASELADAMTRGDQGEPQGIAGAVLDAMLGKVEHQ